MLERREEKDLKVVEDQGLHPPPGPGAQALWERKHPWEGLHGEPCPQGGPGFCHSCKVKRHPEGGPCRFGWYWLVLGGELQGPDGKVSGVGKEV